MERTPNKSQHTKLTLEKKLLPPLLPGLELATFRSRVRRSDERAIPAACRLVAKRRLLYDRVRLSRGDPVRWPQAG